MQLKEKEILLQEDVQQEQPEAILRMQEDTEALEELVSRTVMCMYMYVCMYMQLFMYYNARINLDISNCLNSFALTNAPTII